MKPPIAMPTTPTVVTLGFACVLGALVGVCVGLAAALFLYLLDHVTQIRVAHGWLVLGLPVAAAALVWSYLRFGATAGRGMAVILDEVATRDAVADDVGQMPGATVPFRMAPMVMAGTLFTHLFGGSAGREGTAVQMGASLGSAVASVVGAPVAVRRLVVMAGMAGGFAAVFGTPIAGALFALEVSRRRVELRQLLLAAVPVVIAAAVGDQVCLALGTVHTTYNAGPALPLGPVLIGKWVAVAVAAAAVAHAYIFLVDRVRAVGSKISAPALAAVGGAVIVGAWWVWGDTYLGLGVPTIVRAFSDDNLPYYAFACKLALTAITIGVRMIGGEVTPLFFIGATLGNGLAGLLGLP
ncbi:MAG: chloride channel protein, partial [Kofleriaceae bacterium]|nr:chloride channel protein [Kofleriaceae bacterium]